MSGTSSPAYQSQMQSPGATASDTNALSFFVSRMMSRMVTVMLVRVEAVTAPGGVAPAGTVNIRPMVHQVDGQGGVTPHGTVFSIPYFRLQGGANAIVLDPAVGDIGLAAVCMRDISVVKAAKKPSPPGSARMYDWADALYLGGVLNGPPSQYVLFSGNTVTVHGANEVIISAANKVSVNAPILATTGQIQAAGQITANFGTGSSVTLRNHTHPTNGSPPTPGT